MRSDKTSESSAFQRATRLRQQAEAFLRTTGTDIQAIPVEEVQRLVHELQVYQIELEMQNEELQRAQQELAMARDRYSDLYDFAPVGYLTLDREGVIVEANLTVATLLGVDRGRLLQKKLAHFIAPADQDIFYRHRQALHATGTRQTCELHLQPQGGRPLVVGVVSTVAPDESGANTRCHTALTDISERKHVEEQVQQQRDLLDVTLSSIGDAVVAADATGTITFMNPEAEKLTGWTLQDARGRPIDDVVRLLNEETRQPTDGFGARVLQEKRTIALDTCAVIIRRDGREIPVADSAAPIRSSDGTLHGVVMVFRDITQDRRTTQDLLQAKETAEAASRVKSEFLATMSHEMRTPLHIIMGYTDLMIENEFGPITEEERTTLQRIRRSATELFELISAMLDLNRMETGQVRVEVTAVRVPELLAEMQVDTQGLQEQSSLAFVWRIDAMVPPIRTDRGKLKVVVKNLLSNAVKFTAEGSITVEVRGRENGVAISVTDTGIGIPPEGLAVIFEPFRQLDNPVRHVHGGTGLGLHIVKRLLGLLQGTIEVESEVGRGSTFRVWVPSLREEGKEAI